RRPPDPARRSRAADVCARARPEVYVNLAAPRPRPSEPSSLPPLPACCVSSTHDQQKAAPTQRLLANRFFPGKTDSLQRLARLERRRAQFRTPQAEVTFDQIAKSKAGRVQQPQPVGFLLPMPCGAHGFCSASLRKPKPSVWCMASNRPGAFLVRLSESTGALSVTRCPRLGQAESLDPFTDAELQAAPLADRLFSEPGLVWLLDAEGRLPGQGGRAGRSREPVWGRRQAARCDGYVPRRRGGRLRLRLRLRTPGCQQSGGEPALTAGHQRIGFGRTGSRQTGRLPLRRSGTRCPGSRRRRNMPQGCLASVHWSSQNGHDVFSCWDDSLTAASAAPALMMNSNIVRETRATGSWVGWLELKLQRRFGCRLVADTPHVSATQSFTYTPSAEQQFRKFESFALFQLV
uniref:SH2 domain-containing protein n=1 Tax=Macrostomum lignano TaxID=282301 RepID=A0A1I8FEH4_9PLAT